MIHKTNKSYSYITKIAKIMIKSLLKKYKKSPSLATMEHYIFNGIDGKNHSVIEIQVDNKQVIFDEEKLEKNINDIMKMYQTNPRGAYYTDTGKYIHDVINTAESIRKYARPHKVMFRIRNLSKGRKAVIGYWGRKIRGRHTHYAINKILWPIKEYA